MMLVEKDASAELLLEHLDRQIPGGQEILKAKYPQNNNMDLPPIVTEEKPARPTKPIEPPTTTQGRPAVTNNPPAAIPRTDGDGVGRPMKTISPRPTKKTGNDDSDGGEDKPNKTSAKKSPNTSQAGDMPIKTSDPWGGEFVLPTTPYQPRWMRNDTKSVLPNLTISLSLSFVLFLIALI